MVGRVNEPRFTLYRWYDQDGTLLYVGQSVSVWKRVAEHRRGSAFYAEAATMTLEHHASRVALDEAERDAIRSEHPRFNVTHAVPGVAAKITVRAGDGWVRLGDPGAAPEGWVATDVFDDDLPEDGAYIRVLRDEDDEVRLEGIIDGAEEDYDGEMPRVLLWVFGDCWEAPPGRAVGYHEFAVYVGDRVEIYHAVDPSTSEVWKAARRREAFAVDRYWAMGARGWAAI